MVGGWVFTFALALFLSMDEPAFHFSNDNADETNLDVGLEGSDEAVVNLSGANRAPTELQTVENLSDANRVPTEWQMPSSVDGGAYDLLVDESEQPVNRRVSDILFATEIDTQEEEAHFDHNSTQTALSQTLPMSSVQHFWESDPFLSSVFGKGNVVDDLFTNVNLKRPHTSLTITVDDDSHDEKPVVKALYKGSKRPIYMSAVKHSAIENNDAKRMAALSGWTTLVLINVDAFSAFDEALDQAFRQGQLRLTDADVREVTQRTLLECLARKATSTLMKRLGSLKRFVRFCSRVGVPPFPLEEQSMYDFMQALKSQAGSGASSGRSFLEAVRFSGAMLGLKSTGQCMVSPRLAGLGEILSRQAKPMVQASPLTVKQIVALERLCCCGESLHDRVISGGVLMMIFGCARASDISRAVRLTVDRVEPGVELTDGEPCGYIEIGVLGHKGARTSQHKRMLLPVVAPMMSISDGQWWDSWLEARMALQLEVSGEVSLPLLCKFDLDGKPTDHSLQASEIGEFIRQALNVETEARNLIRSHSCKVSMLSWMAKCGSPLNLRRNIGHHLDVTSKSAEIYARDAMAPALYELCRVIGMVKAGKFDPDCTRSGRFSGPSQIRETTAGKDVRTGWTKVGSEEGDISSVAESDDLQQRDGDDEHLAGDTDETDTDSSSDACSIEAGDVDDSTTLAELWDMIRPSLRPKLVNVHPELQKFVHTFSLVVHLKREESNRFLCGRLASDRYEQRPSGTSVECPRCTTCFQSKEAKGPVAT